MEISKLRAIASTELQVRLKPGVVLKSSRWSWWTSSTTGSHDIAKDIKHSFCVEMKMLGILGPHPNLVKYGNPKSSSGSIH